MYELGSRLKSFFIASPHANVVCFVSEFDTMLPNCPNCRLMWLFFHPNLFHKHTRTWLTFPVTKPISHSFACRVYIFLVQITELYWCYRDLSWPALEDVFSVIYFYSSKRGWIVISLQIHTSLKFFFVITILVQEQSPSPTIVP